MTGQEAKAILLLYRPGTADAEDPEIIQAMEVARREPDLGRWFDQHRSFQAAMQSGFRQIEAPEHLKAALLAGQAKVVPLRSWWQSPVWLAAAAAVVLLLALTAIWRKPAVPDRFADYQQTMVGKAERGYAMQWKTSNMQELRQAIGQSKAPADYDVTQGLQKLSLTGGAVFPWRSNPVAMVCFDRGHEQMVFLFVLKKSAVKDPPPETPQQGKVGDFLTASWTRGDKTYLLAAPEEADFKKYLPQL